ncbi:MAG: NTP transferase domain-containing protein [Puniceicoccaceae bacterium]
MDDQITLLVLAAGMGSRYGGIKQLEPMGPNGETLLDYSVHDALKAGFGKVVFVIRREIEEPFRKTVGKRYEDLVPIEYVFQELDDLPQGHTAPEGRSKPWGTGQAILAARDVIDGCFAVINADDFYGQEAYAVISRYFTESIEKGTTPLCMVGYLLDHTLSLHGSVNRGLCQGTAGRLQSVEEIIDIDRDRHGTILGTNGNGKEVILPPDALVSMNFWGFSSMVFPDLERHFIRFLQGHSESLTGEFYIPTFVDDLITMEGAQCDLLQTDASWFGVTYPGDKPYVQQRLSELIGNGVYPSPLNG